MVLDASFFRAILVSSRGCFVFNWATECKEEMDKNLRLFSERMNRSDLNIHWNYIIQNV